MAAVTLNVYRSDRYPVGTAVEAFAGGARVNNGQLEGEPAGTPLEEATVGTTGTLTFTGLAEGSIVTLEAEVGGEIRNTTAGNGPGPQGFPSPPPTLPSTLRERINLRRLASGCIENLPPGYLERERLTLPFTL